MILHIGEHPWLSIHGGLQGGRARLVPKSFPGKNELDQKGFPLAIFANLQLHVPKKYISKTQSLGLMASEMDPDFWLLDSEECGGEDLKDEQTSPKFKSRNGRPFRRGSDKDTRRSTNGAERRIANADDSSRSMAGRNGSHEECRLLLAECIREGNLPQALAALKAFSVIEGGGMADMHSYRSVMDLCGRCGATEAALTVYEGMLDADVQPNVFVYNSLMNVLVHDWDAAWELYSHMQAAAVEPDVATFNVLLKSCARTGRARTASKLYRDMKKWAAARNIILDVISYSSVIQVFAEAKDWQAALAVKDDMVAANVTPNVVTWTSLMRACSKAGLVEQAFQLFEEMLEAGVEPNTVTYNTLIDACAEAGQEERAFALLDEMKKRGKARKEGVERREKRKGRKRDCQVEGLGYGRSCSSADTSNDSRMFIEGDAAVLATTLTERNEDDLSKWKDRTSSASNGSSFHPEFPGRFSVVDQEAELLKGVERMRSRGQQEGVSQKRGSASRRVEFSGRRKSEHGEHCAPNEVTYNTLMKACGGSPKRAVALMKEMRQFGLRPNEKSWAAVLDAHGTCGDLSGALEVFKDMQNNRVSADVVAYTALIKACIRAGDEDMAYSVLKDMKAAGVRPNLVTYTTLLRQQPGGGALRNVQRALALYQDMRAAGYAANDHLLKGLLKDWAEGALDENSPRQKQEEEKQLERPVASLDSIGEGSRGNALDFTERLMEKVARHDRKGPEQDLLTVDLRGLSKVESRTAVLSVLRIIKERHKCGQEVFENLLISTGSDEVRSGVKEEVLHLLRDVLCLPVVMSQDREDEERKKVVNGVKQKRDDEERVKAVSREERQSRIVESSSMGDSEKKERRTGIGESKLGTGLGRSWQRGGSTSPDYTLRRVTKMFENAEKIDLKGGRDANKVGELVSKPSRMAETDKGTLIIPAAALNAWLVRRK